MLNWDAFTSLPGAQEDNFEILCRILIHWNYGRFGEFNALAMQPGVEFDLKLHTACSLGEPGRWYGWQCRWYGLPGGRALGATRRNKIVEAIRTTERELPGLTDWVLWTRHPLTEGDQTWFKALDTPMQLHQWTAANVEEEISRDAVIFRSTYFGELILTPEILSQKHHQSVAQIKQRWQPEVHQIIDAERSLRQMLGEPGQWEDLESLASRIATSVSAVKNDSVGLPEDLSESLVGLISLGNDCVALIQTAHTLLRQGDLERLIQQLAVSQVVIPANLAILPRRLRTGRFPAAISITNLLAELRWGSDLLKEVTPVLSTRLIAVTAEAGCGKTELAAQLTAELGDRPAGLLLHGRDLSAGSSLDDLAHRIVIQGRPVPSMEALLAAVDSAGRRAHRRLPIVIDGLNESEDPRDWKNLLATLEPTLPLYPYILLVCTLRTQFVQEALPIETRQLEIPGFEEDASEAIRRYFRYYRINARDALLPIGLLRHPLTLRLFCEVTNPSRAHEVSVEAMPETLTGLFDRYLEQTIIRVADLAPRTRRLYEMDIREAFNEIGKALWEEGTRSLDLAPLRKLLRDDHYSWGDSIVRALEHNGILLRDRGHQAGSTSLSVLYDLLAGHMIADAIITERGQSSLETWLKDPKTINLLLWPSPESHPLGTDVFRALVGLVPRRLRHRQLWQLLEGPLQLEGLRRVADLEGTYIDAESVKRLLSLASESREEAQHLFDRLEQTRAAPKHPLNSEFLDALLRPMSVAERDLVWTEWIRRHRDTLDQDLQRLEKQWRVLGKRDNTCKLRARWVKWMLTSTDHKLRDQATSTLYWFGRGDPEALFELALGSLDINDPYVSERMLAASYGVIMAHSLYDPGFAPILSAFLDGLNAAFAGANPTHPTNHYLIRLYVQGMFTFAQKYYSSTVSEAMKADGLISFSPGLAIEQIERDDSRAGDVRSTLHMDFENYTVGRLIEHRRNYDLDHLGHQAALAYIRGTIWELGWREPSFGKIDQDIMQYSKDRDRSKTERYGKKYSWIGFYSYAGILADRGELPRANQRLSEVDIDPSFPELPPPAPISLTGWVQSTPEDNELWIRNGRVEISDELLYRHDIESHSGPWIATYGFLEGTNHELGRQVFGFLSALLVSPKDEGRLVNLLNGPEHPGRFRLSDPPDEYYIFAGEIPWHPEFARGEGGEGPAALYQGEVRSERGKPIQVELLAHRYTWESYHSFLNDAGGAYIPPRPFSTAFDLRGIPQAFDQTLPDGSTAAMSFTVPSGFEGHLLYLREDLLYQYAAGRQLVWFLWGEKQLDPYPDPTPEWLIKIQQTDADAWRHVRRGDTLSRLFATK